MVESSITGELAAHLPQFDPLAPRTQQRTARRVVILSLLLHLIAFWVFRDFLFGAIVEPEEMVVVRMLEEEIIKPEPPKKRRKILAQRRLDAAVTRQRDVARPEIRVVKPMPVLDQTRKVEVDPTELAEAPKKIEHRKVITENVNVFAEVPTQAQPVEVDRINPEVQKVQTARASAGPRLMEAAGPQTTTRAVDVEAPMIAEGVLSRSAVAGDTEGARIAALESGVSDKMLDGRGDRGVLSGIKRDCEKHPKFQEYMDMVEDRVYARWHVQDGVEAGKVVIRFKVDRGGSAHGIKLAKADDPELGNTCLAAFRHASPFPPPPREIECIINKGIKGTFTYGD